ncbi:MAG: TraB/GumN family protein [Nitrososphaerales archaeon]|nr:TraB/GumN family protein [Nitrososphaerales archaeon]
MISYVPDSRRPILEPPERNPLPFAPRPSPGGARVGQFDLVGTAHFTRRSVAEAIAAASSASYSSVALELDRRRFAELDEGAFAAPPGYRALAEGEFVAAADAFGNRDGDIWLIDMNMDEIRARIGRRLTWRELAAWNEVSRRLAPYEAAGTRLWESGREDEAMRYLDLTTRAMESYSPTLFRVLIEERNLVMAARLGEVASRSEERTLALVGKAHVDAISKLLADPRSIQEGLRRNGLNYSPPVRIRRAKVN